MSTSKIFYVANAIQAALMTEVFIHEFTEGFWKGQRPIGHGDVWKDVEVKVTEDGTLGPIGFTPTRLYNLLNPDFYQAMEERLMEVVKAIKPEMTFKRLKPELIEVSQMIGGRLTNVNVPTVKLFRGNNRNDGKIVVSSANARKAGLKLSEAAKMPIMAVSTEESKNAKPNVLEKLVQHSKRTVTKATNGATTTRVEVSTSSFPFASIEAKQVEETVDSMSEVAETAENPEISASAE